MPPCLLLLAEVMDKEPTAARYWAVASLLALVGYGAVRWRPWAILLVGPVVLLHVSATILHVDDPCIHAAMRAEAGWGYVLQVHASLLLALLGPTWAIVRSDLPAARAWWAEVGTWRATQFAVEGTPYRRLTPSTRTPAPWRLALVLGAASLFLQAVAVVQGDRVLTRCTWNP